MISLISIDNIYKILFKFNLKIILIWFKKFAKTFLRPKILKIMNLYQNTKFNKLLMSLLIDLN